MRLLWFYLVVSRYLSTLLLVFPLSKIYLEELMIFLDLGTITGNSSYLAIMRINNKPKCYLLNSKLFLAHVDIWAAAWQNRQNGMCAQRRLRSAWASAQTDQSSLSALLHIGSLATHRARSEGSDQTGWISRLIWVFARRICHFVGFVVLWLIYIVSFIFFLDSYLVS